MIGNDRLRQELHARTPILICVRCYLTSTFVTFSLLGGAFAAALTTGHAEGGLVARSSPTNEDLLASCPGGPKDHKLKRADRCTLINIKQNPDVRLWTVLGDPQLNCGGSQHPITVTLGGATTVSQTTTVNAEFGASVEGISIGGGVSDSETTSTTMSKSIEFSISPGRQAVYVVGVAYTSETGNVQVNYGSRVEGHYEYYTGTTVTKLTPKENDVEYDVHESDCGKDPRNLDNALFVALARGNATVS